MSKPTFAKEVRDGKLKIIRQGRRVKVDGREFCAGRDAL